MVKLSSILQATESVAVGWEYTGILDIKLVTRTGSLGQICRVGVQDIELVMEQEVGDKSVG